MFPGKKCASDTSSKSYARSTVSNFDSEFSGEGVRVSDRAPADRALKARSRVLCFGAELGEVGEFEPLLELDGATFAD